MIRIKEADINIRDFQRHEVDTNSSVGDGGLQRSQPARPPTAPPSSARRLRPTTQIAEDFYRGHDEAAPRTSEEEAEAWYKSHGR